MTSTTVKFAFADSQHSRLLFAVVENVLIVIYSIVSRLDGKPREMVFKI